MESTPGILSSGKAWPQSMTTISSSHSITVIFIPIWSRPPKGMILTDFLARFEAVSPRARDALAEALLTPRLLFTVLLLLIFVTLFYIKVIFIGRSKYTAYFIKISRGKFSCHG